MAVRLDSRWDLSVNNRDGQLVLVVEVKSKNNVSTEWVTKFRRNILAHGIFPKAPYFLMVFPNKFYLWANAEDHLDQSEPTYIIDSRSVLEPYFERAGVTADQISEQSLVLIIASWLGEVIHSEKLSENIESSQQWLVESGLYAALAQGTFEHEAAA